MSADRYNIGEVQWPDTPFPLLRHAILIGKRGSEAHGTYTPPANPDSIDDRDIMGVCIPPLDFYYGTRRWDGADAIKGCWDVVLYGVQKFISLLCQQNPNLLCMLWLHPDDYLLVSPEGQAILDSREMFRSRRRAYDSFVGYANGQLRRMTHFGAYQGYMGAKRKELVDRHGYDTKNAAHLVRLLRVGIEYMREQRINVRRTHDLAQILAIKRGEWSLDRVLELADRLFAEARDAYEHSAMPDAIDEEAVNRIAVEITSAFFARSAR